MSKTLKVLPVQNEPVQKVSAYVKEERERCIHIAISAGVPHEVLLSFAMTLEEWLQRPPR